MASPIERRPYTGCRRPPVVRWPYARVCSGRSCRAPSPPLEGRVWPPGRAADNRVCILAPPAGRRASHPASALMSAGATVPYRSVRDLQWWRAGGAPAMPEMIRLVHPAADPFRAAPHLG